jgi:hypothetical protein
LFLCHTAAAQPDPAVTSVTVDENGNGIGTLGGGFLAQDPGPDGRLALTYNLPFAGSQGDVLSIAADSGDIIRFNGNGTLIFYSDFRGGVDALGDTPSPAAFYLANLVPVTEVGPEGNNGFFYTPTAGQPGSVPGAVVVYHLVSDGTVPEPATLTLLGLGLAGLGFSRRRKSN